MAITSGDTLIAGFQPPTPLYKISATTEAAGTWFSLYRVGGLYTATAIPPAYTAGSNYVPTNATVGALPFTNPVSGETRLVRLAASSTVIGTLIIYDRLWHCSGFGTVVTSAQAITTPGSIGRYTDYTGVELWGEVYTAPGATTATWTASYTNQSGTSGRSATYFHPANAETVGQMFPFILAAGDTGVQAVASMTCSVSSGTAGSIGFTVLRRLAELPITLANVASVLDFVGTSMPQIKNDACLAMMVQCSTTTSGMILGSFSVAQG